MVILSLPTPVEFYFKDSDAFASNDCLDYAWTMPIDPLSRVMMYGESIEVPQSLNQEGCSSNNTSAMKISENLLSRKKIWSNLFNTLPMPEAHIGAVEESYGLLDGCFAENKLSSEEVFYLLKKAK